MSSLQIYSPSTATLSGNPARVKIGGFNLNNIRYADESVLMVDSERKLKDLLDWLVEESNNKRNNPQLQKTERYSHQQKRKRPRYGLKIVDVNIKM